ncbi:MAG: DUF3592 domain-containing protein [Planctomycetaceae bacterium]|nr:DUF3592 domain-containing protein [Planctomycetaceae bacterium]
MIEILIGLMIPVVIVAVIVVNVVRRSWQMRELCEQGIETSGQVIEKRKLPRRRVSPRRYKLVYCYTDQAGVTHTHTSVVSDTLYAGLEIGSPIAVVYSTKRPDVSTPKYLVDECRGALGK